MKLRRLVLAAALSVASVAQQPAASTQALDQQDPGPPDVHSLDEAHEAVREAEAAHPGNTPQVAEALLDLLDLEADSMPPNDAMLQEAKRDLDVAEKAEGRESGLHANAMAYESWVYLRLDRPELARPSELAILTRWQMWPVPSPISVPICGTISVFSRMPSWD
jgi:hypothetical protein